MIDYEIKYKKKEINIVCGGIWSIATLVWTILLISIIYIRGFTPPLRIGFVYMVFVFLLNVILDFTLAKYYITLSSRTYIKIYDKELEIHKGLLRKNQFIKFKDIEEVRWIGEKIVIILMNYCSNKEVEIWLNLMYLKDLDILLNYFSKNNKLVKRL